jgi:uncharacterized protein YkwD
MSRWVSVCALAGLALVSVAAQAPAADDPAARLEALIRADRSSLELPALDADPALTAEAEAIAAGGGSVDAASHLGDWGSFGTIAGRAADADAFWADAMSAPVQRANVLDPGYTAVGVGVARDGSDLVAVVLFGGPAHDDGDMQIGAASMTRATSGQAASR